MLISPEDTIIVTDPCYFKEDYPLLFDNLQPGKWNNRIVKYNNLIKSIEIFCSVNSYIFHDYVSVDSGQVGIFIESKYPSMDDHNRDDIYDSNTFYGRCCLLTLYENLYGVLEEGIVSSTGYGDGQYPVYFSKDHLNRITGIQIVFIDDKEDDNDYG